MFSNLVGKKEQLVGYLKKAPLLLALESSTPGLNSPGTGAREAEKEGERKKRKPEEGLSNPEER